MNFRVTAILFAVVIVLVTILLVRSLVVTEDAPAAGGLVPGLQAAGVKPEQVETVELTRSLPDQPAQKLVLQKQDQRWVATAPAPAAVDSFTVDSFVRDLFSAKPVDYPGLTTNLSTHGLSQPTYTVTLKKGDLAATINLGTTLMGREKAVTFVTTGERPDTPLAVRTTDLRGLFRDEDREKGGAPHIIAKWLSDFRQKRLLSIPAANPTEELTAVGLRRGDKTVALTRTGEDWKFTTPEAFGLADVDGDPGQTPDRFSGVRPLLNSLVSLQVDSVSDFIENVPPTELGQYGLASNDPAAIRAELKPKDRPAEVLFIGKRVEKGGNPVTPPKVYCRVEGDSAVAVVPTDRLQAFINAVADPSTLRSRSIVTGNKQDRIDAVDSTFGGGLKLRRVTGQTRTWALYGGPNDPTPAQEQEVAALIGAVTRPRVATAVLPTPNDAAFAGSERKGELKVWVGGVETTKPTADGKLPPEPTVKGEPITILFGTIEGTEVNVRRTVGGVSDDLKVPADLLVPVSRSRTAYVDPQLGTFDPSAADHLVLFRNGSRSELRKQPDADSAYPNGKWAFVASDDRNGQVADGDQVFSLLSTLSGIRLPRIHAESATPEELKALGLDPASPVMSAKVGLPKGGDGEREYQFGNETADKQGVYMRLIGKPFVLIVDKSVADRISGANLADKVVFRVDPKRVQKLFLNGWKADGPDGKPVEVVLERQNGVWVATEPAGAAVDTARVNAILSALEAPKAIAELPVKSDQPAPPEYGFSDRPLSIVVELDDKSSRYLQLGGEHKAQSGIYARTGGKTYLLGPQLLRPILEKPPLIGR